MAKLTKRFVDSVDPDPKRDVFVWDDELAGFGLRVKPSGRKAYLIQYRQHGRTRRLTLGAHGVLTPDKARKEAIKKLAEVAEGGDPSETRKLDREAITVKYLAERYMEEHAKPKKRSSSVTRDQKLIDRFIVPILGPLKVKAVTRANVIDMHRKVGQKTPIQANRTLALLSKMMSLAIRWGLRPDAAGNPCRYVERYRENKHERFLSPAELARLGKALEEYEKEGDELPSVFTAVRLLIFTGCRRQEILTLKWEHVDFANSCLRLPDSKTGAKIVPIGAPVIEILKKTPRIQGNPYVCPGLKPGQHLVGLPRAWARIQKIAKLEDVRIHDLRHSFASIGVSSGLGLPIIGAILGHTQAATTQRYAHLSNDPLKAAADQITQQISEAMNKPVSDSNNVIPFKRSK
jgi:integrase